MGRIRDWIIHSLGGCTVREYREECVKTESAIAKYEAINDVHKQLFDWFDKPRVKCFSQDKVCAVVVSSSLEDGVPIDYIKQELCSRLAKKMMNDDLLSFDIYDDPSTRDRLYKGTIHLLQPKRN